MLLNERAHCAMIKKDLKKYWKIFWGSSEPIRGLWGAGGQAQVHEGLRLLQGTEEQTPQAHRRSGRWGAGQQCRRLGGGDHWVVFLSTKKSFPLEIWFLAHDFYREPRVAAFLKIEGNEGTLFCFVFHFFPPPVTLKTGIPVPDVAISDILSYYWILLHLQYSAAFNATGEDVLSSSLAAVAFSFVCFPVSVFFFCFCFWPPHVAAVCEMSPSQFLVRAQVWRHKKHWAMGTELWKRSHTLKT